MPAPQPAFPFPPAAIPPIPAGMNALARPFAPADTRDLIACPTCDMLHREVAVPVGGRLRCQRCHAVLLTNRANAIDRALAGSFASVILMLAAIFFPFLELSIAGLRRKASLLDAAMAFSSGLVVPLSVATALLIVVLPLVRATALGYTLLPLRLRGRAAARRRARLPHRLPPAAVGDGRGLPHRRHRRAREDRRHGDRHPRPRLLGDGRASSSSSSTRRRASTNGRYGSSSTPPASMSPPAP